MGELSFAIKYGRAIKDRYGIKNHAVRYEKRKFFGKVLKDHGKQFLCSDDLQLRNGQQLNGAVKFFDFKHKAYGERIVYDFDKIEFMLLFK